MKHILFGIVFLHNVLVSDPNDVDDTAAEAGADQDELNRPCSSSCIHRVCGSVTNKCSAFGSCLGVASKTDAPSPGCEHPNASLHSSSTLRDELSTPSGDTCCNPESVSPGQQSAELSFHDAEMEIQDHASPPGPGTPQFSTSPGNPARLCFRVSRMRVQTSPQTQMDSSNTLVNIHVIDIDLEGDVRYGNRPPWGTTPMKLGKTFLGLTYQAIVSFLIFHYQAAGNSSSQDHSPKLSRLLLQIAEVNLAVSFTCCLIGILLRQIYQESSVIVERVGSMSAAFGFFIMVSMLLTSISEWVGWICAVGSLLAFVVVFIKRKKD